MYREGQTATNPKTGQKVVYKGGQWVNAAAPPSVDRSHSMSPHEQKTISDLRVAAQNIRGAREQAEEFGKLNREVGTGGIFAIPGVSEIWSALDPRVATLQGLSNAMIPGMHVTPGPMTDADAKLYKSAIPNPNLPGPANAALRRDIGRKEEIAAARSAYFERWAAERGSLNGAEQGFNRFWRNWESQKRAKEAPRTNRGDGGGVRYLGTE